MPDSATLASAAAVDVVVAATRFALAVELRRTPGADVDWSGAPVGEIEQAVRLHRVAPLLAAHAAALGMPDGLVVAVRQVARADTLAGLQLAGQSLRALDAVRAAGVPTLLVKGVALAALTTGSPAARGAGDIDLLVRPEDLERVHIALTEAGWDGEDLFPAGAWRRWYLTMRRERSYVSPASSIDLHWRIGWHSRPIPSADVLLGRAGAVTIADRPVPTLSLADTLAAACYHAAFDRYARIRQFVDIARLLALPGVSLPADAHWRLRRLVAEAVTVADALLGPLPGTERFAPPGRVDPAPLLALWRYSSVRPEWSGADTPLAGHIDIYRDSARFGGVPAAVRMALTDALLPPERVRAGMSPVEVAGQVGAEVADLVRRRVLG